MGVQRNLDGGNHHSPAVSEQAQAGPAFKRSLAHELGNLLQVINGNLELLSARTEDERLRSYISNAQTAAQQLTRITHDLSERDLDESA